MESGVSLQDICHPEFSGSGDEKMWGSSGKAMGAPVWREGEERKARFSSSGDRSMGDPHMGRKVLLVGLAQFIPQTTTFSDLELLELTLTILYYHWID